MASNFLLYTKKISGTVQIVVHHIEIMYKELHNLRNQQK